MIDVEILTAIEARLAALLAPPQVPFRPLRVDATTIGFLDDARAARLARFTDVFVVTDRDIAFVPDLADCASRTAALDRIARELASQGMLSAWRDEKYAVAPAFGLPALFLLERAAARYFGIRTFAVHVNGTTLHEGRERMWIARRSSSKSIDPGMLDNMIGGGIAAGMDVARTLVKEAFEEAGIPADVAAQAVPRSEIEFCRLQPDGLQHEVIFAHDLVLPGSLLPRSQDGEVCGWRAMAVDEVARVVALQSAPDEMTADASLVALDWMLRHGHIDREGPIAVRLSAHRAPRWSTSGSL